MDILTVKHASTFHGNNTRGFILAWQSHKDDKLVYEHVVSYPICRTKLIAQDIIRLVCILAYVDSLGFEYTLYNTYVTRYAERDRIQFILYTEDQTLLELYDDNARELIDDGFIDPRNLHESMLAYYKLIG